jgi:hypothetical protein
MKRHYPLLLNNGFGPYLDSMVVMFLVFFALPLWTTEISISGTTQSEK